MCYVCKNKANLDILIKVAIVCVHNFFLKQKKVITESIYWITGQTGRIDNEKIHMKQVKRVKSSLTCSQMLTPS